MLAVLGGLIGQLGGNALYEEIAYRGFLFPQVWARLAARWPARPGRALVAALLGSQALFALRHVPIRILQGFDPVDLAISLAMVLAIGVIYALLYLRTQNLFLVIGVHALYDAPTALFAPTLVGSSLLLLAATVVTLLVWPRVTRRSHATGPLEAARPS